MPWVGWVTSIAEIPLTFRAEGTWGSSSSAASEGRGGYKHQQRHYASASSVPPTPPPEPIPLPTDVMSGEALSSEDRAKLDHEVLEFSKRMQARADAKDWDQVKADLEVYVLAGEKVTEDPTRTAEYKAKVIEGLRLEDTSQRPG